MMNLMKIDGLKRRFRQVNRDQKGAMAVLSLAAILIIIMVGMTLYDVAELGVEKTHLQTATDSAAYSQATVEARSMNMMAFTNVGKRMTVGMVNTYVNLNQWLLNITHIGAYMTLICVGATIAFPPMATFCSYLAQATSGANWLESGESSPRGDVYSKSGPKCWVESWGCSCSLSGCSCGWSCDERYKDWHEWAAPVSPTDSQILTLLLPIIPCGKLMPFVGPKWGPLSCADGDIMNWNAERLLNNYYGRDLMGMDNYQRYMSALAPYWAWSEGSMRGMLNKAPVTVSYPMPDFEETQEHVAHLPVHRGTWNDTCDRATSHDRGVDSLMALDIALKNLLSGLTGGSPSPTGPAQFGAIAAMFISGIAAMEVDDLRSGNPINEMLPRGWNFLCHDVTSQLFAKAQGGGSIGGFLGFGGGNDYVSGFKKYGKPMLLNEYDGDGAQWLMDSSTLTFGFRPNASRFGEGRDKFFVFGDHHSWGPEAGGTWAMARSEISYQGSGSPSVWSPGWTARMRPVALPGEWEGYGDFSISDAFAEVAGTIEETTMRMENFNESTNDLITHPHGNANIGGAMGEELSAMEAALQGLDDERMEGLIR